MGFGVSFFVVLIMLFGSGPRAGSDALDTLSTTSYWQSKHFNVTEPQLEADAGPAPKPEHLEELMKDLESPEYRTRNAAKKRIIDIGPAALPLLRTDAESKDPEVKATAGELVIQLSNHAKERDVRRLMAIRTLGERKESAALPMLTALAGSKEFFIAEYAARAIAQIQSKPLPHADHRPAVTADLNLLPENAGIVAQTVGLAHETLTVEALIDMAIAQAPQGMPGRKLPPRDAILQRAVAEWLKEIEKIGDVRIDGLTVEVSADAGHNAGSGIILLRGEFDRAAAVDAIRAILPPDSHKLEVQGTVFVWDVGDATLVMPSNEQLAIVLADNAPARIAAVDDLLTAIKTGKGTLEQNHDMAALMKTIDTQSPLWIAARLNKDMRVGVLDGFDTVTLATKADDDKTSFTFSAHGVDGDKVKSSVEEMNTDIVTARAQTKMMAQQMKRLQPMVDLLQSLKVEQNGINASMTGELKKTILQAIAGELGPMMLMEMESTPDIAPQP